MPLFNVLGYDYALAIGLFIALGAVDIGHGAVAAARRSGARAPAGPGAGGRNAGGCWRRWSFLWSSALLNAVRVRNCNLPAGFLFFTLLPVATALYAAPVGVLAGLAFPRSGRLVAYLIPLASVVWSLWRLYSDPPVFVFDPFGGYFPGPIYDEALRPPERLVHFRLVNLIWIGAAVATAATVLRRRQSWRRLVLPAARRCCSWPRRWRCSWNAVGSVSTSTRTA